MNIDIDPNDKSVKVLIVEDDDYAREKITAFVKRSFTLAQIFAPDSFYGTDSLDSALSKRQYNLILLDGSLKKWGIHHVFGNEGIKLIPYIKERFPKTIAVAISSDDFSNRDMVIAGADLYIDKKVFFERDKMFTQNLSVQIIE